MPQVRWVILLHHSLLPWTPNLAPPPPSCILVLTLSTRSYFCFFIYIFLDLLILPLSYCFLPSVTVSSSLSSLYRLPHYFPSGCSQVLIFSVSWPWIHTVSHAYYQLSTHTFTPNHTTPPTHPHRYDNLFNSPSQFNISLFYCSSTYTLMQILTHP